MNILSLYLGHNSTIAYAEDGKLLAVLHEEKFDNVKNSDNFPIKSLRYLASKHDLKRLDKVMIVGKGINFWMLRYIEKYTKADKHKIISFMPTFYDRTLYVLAKYFPQLMNRINDFYIYLRQQKFASKVYELIDQGL